MNLLFMPGSQAQNRKKILKDRNNTSSRSLQTTALFQTSHQYQFQLVSTNRHLVVSSKACLKVTNGRLYLTESRGITALFENS